MARRLLSLEYQQEQARAYVLAVCAAKDIKPSKLAREIGRHPSTLARFLNNKDVTHTLELKTIYEIAAWSGVPLPDELLAAYGVQPGLVVAGDPIPPGVMREPDSAYATDSPLGRPNAAPAPPPERPDFVNKIRELGLAQAGREGQFYLNGETVDYHNRPPGLAHRMQVYCIRVQGGSMSPAYEDGDLIFVDAARKPFPGRDALIEMKATEEGGNKAAFIKRVVALNSEFVELMEFKPKERTFRVERRKIENLHLVLKNNDMY